MSTGDFQAAQLCGHCGRPVATAVWLGAKPYHEECTHGPGWVQPVYSTSDQPLTIEWVRRIVREELGRAIPRVQV